MRQETTSNEAELRAEIEELKRQLEHKHAGASEAEHVVRPSRHAIRNLVLLFVVILIVGFVAGYVPRHHRELQLVAEADTHNEALPQVSVMTARRAEGRGNLVLPGNIQAVTEAPILARAEGFLKTRYVDIGDRVTAGQLLAEIEAPDLNQQVRQAQAAVQQSEADLERASAALEQGKANESLAKVTAERWDNLVKRGVVSRQENDQYQAQYTAQSANVHALDRSVAAAKSNIAAVEANVEAMVRRCVSELGGLEVFFANIGVTGTNTPLLEQSVEEWEGVYRINTISCFLAIKYAGRHMTARGYGSIILTSSAASLRANAGAISYSASKAAVNSLAQTAANAFAGTGVRVNAVLPGLVETQLTRSVFEDARARGVENRLGHVTPLKRPGRAEEIAAPQRGEEHRRCDRD